MTQTQAQQAIDLLRAITKSVHHLARRWARSEPTPAPACSTAPASGSRQDRNATDVFEARAGVFFAVVTGIAAWFIQRQKTMKPHRLRAVRRTCRGARLWFWVTAGFPLIAGVLISAYEMLNVLRVEGYWCGWDLLSLLWIPATVLVGVAAGKYYEVRCWLER